MKKRKSKLEIALPMADWSELTGWDRKTIEKRLTGIGIDKATRYKLRDVIRALLSEESLANARIAVAKAEAIELQNQENAGDLLRKADVVRMYDECLQPIRNRFINLPAECCNRVSPHDPIFARTALLEWSDEALKTIREKLECDLPKAKP